MFDSGAPDSDPASQPAVETRPKAVAAWLKRLPVASPADTAQLLLGALDALDRHPLDRSARHALLALYRPAVAHAAASLETLLANAGVPPHAQHRRAGALLRDLHRAHGAGYRQVLAPDKRRLGLTQPRRTVEAAAHLMAALRDTLYASYLTYTAPPAGLWQDMHQLHAFAQASDLAHDAVSETARASQAYCQALLLALADPPHMNHAEIVHTRRYLARFGELARLHPVSASTQRGFVIRTQGDVQPGHLAAVQGEGDLWLDTTALCRQLHDTLIRLRAGETPYDVGLPEGLDGALVPALGKRLLKQWSVATQRAFRRYAAPGGAVQVVAGVSAIHRLLERLPQASAAGDADSLPIHGVGQAFAAPAAVNASRWTVSNDSAFGLALSGVPDAPLNLKVGDPLALRADGAATWSLGTIRWIRMRDARHVDLGVERLAPQVQPLWIRPLRGPRSANPEPALFVPGLPALQQPDRLLLPRHLYEAGMDAEVWHAPRQYLLSFGRRHAHTQAFDLIDFTVFEGEQP